MVASEAANDLILYLNFELHEVIYIMMMISDPQKEMVQGGKS